MVPFAIFEPKITSYPIYDVPIVPVILEELTLCIFWSVTCPSAIFDVVMLLSYNFYVLTEELAILDTVIDESIICAVFTELLARRSFVIVWFWMDAFVSDFAYIYVSVIVLFDN